MTKQIPLTQGQVAIVDDEDMPAVQNIKWFTFSRSGLLYAATNTPRSKGGKRPLILMHRFLSGAMPGQFVDHIDGNGLNNSRSNLRICSHAENMRNRQKRKVGKSKFKGVQIHHGHWRATIRENGNRHELGTFNSEIEAAQAYDAAALKFHKEFARTNF